MAPYTDLGSDAESLHYQVALRKIFLSKIFSENGNQHRRGFFFLACSCVRSLSHPDVFEKLVGVIAIDFVRKIFRIGAAHAILQPFKDFDLGFGLGYVELLIFCPRFIELAEILLTARSRIRTADQLLIIQPYSPALFAQGTLPGPSLLLQAQKGELDEQALRQAWKAAEAKEIESKKATQNWPWSMKLPCRLCILPGP